jgi:hypothetical protein
MESSGHWHRSGTRAKLIDDQSCVEATLESGSRRASGTAKATLREVNEAMKI